MTPVDRAPNIGPALAGDLRAAGIETIEELRCLGATGAWDRVRRANPERDCTHSLLALHGAIRNVRWMALPVEEREEIGRYAAEGRLP